MWRPLGLSRAWAGGVGANARGERLRLLTITGPATTEGTFIEVWLLTAKNGRLVDRQLLVKDGHLDPQIAENYAAEPLHVKLGTLEYTHRWPGISGRWRGLLTEKLTLEATRDPTRRSWPIKLSNWERLAKSPLPAFFFVVHADANLQASEAYLGH